MLFFWFIIRIEITIQNKYNTVTNVLCYAIYVLYTEHGVREHTRNGNNSVLDVFIAGGRFSEYSILNYS